MIRLKSQRVQFSLAWTVSLVVHAMFVVLLYRAYSELRQAQPPTLLISHGDSRTVVLPDLEVQLDGIATIPQTAVDTRRRPDEVAAAAPRRSATSKELLAMQPGRDAVIHETTSASPRPRARAFAPMKVEDVESPASPVASLASPSDLPGLAPAITPLARSELGGAGGWQPESIARPVRIASLPPTGEMRRASSRLFLESTETPGARETRIRRPATAFAHRFGRQSADDDREAAIERGLIFLARVQLDDGRWRFDYLRGAVNVDTEPVNMRADAAATGLALLAFLGAGYDHFDGRYAEVVEQGLHSLMRVQQPAGELFPENGQPAGQVARFYSHGIATLALCEAYGMTGDADLRDAAQRALDHLAATQNPELGGWRYLPGVNTDLSVTGWQTAALRSGELAGLSVDRTALDRAGKCLEKCRDAAGSGALFRYNPWASPSDPLTRHGLQPSTVMTAVGLAMQFQLDRDARDPWLRLSGDHLAANLPELGDSTALAATGTLGNPRRDTYYWYYATQAMFYLGGEPWQKWSDRLEHVLVDSQEMSGRVAGSWDPVRPVPDKWAAYGGRLYVTAMNLLSLEIENRHLRLGKAATEVSKGDDAVTR